jgi:hypothetical protein
MELQYLIRSIVLQRRNVQCWYLLACSPDSTHPFYCSVVFAVLSSACMTLLYRLVGTRRALEVAFLQVVTCYSEMKTGFEKHCTNDLNVASLSALVV